MSTFVSCFQHHHHTLLTSTLSLAHRYPCQRVVTGSRWKVLDTSQKPLMLAQPQAPVLVVELD